MTEIVANQDVFMINDSTFMVDEDGNIYRAVPPVFREAFLDEPDPDPGPAEALFVGLGFLWLAGVLWWRLWRWWI